MGLVPGLSPVSGYPWSNARTHDRVTLGGGMFALVCFEESGVFLMASTCVHLRVLGVNPFEVVPCTGFTDGECLWDLSLGHRTGDGKFDGETFWVGCGWLFSWEGSGGFVTASSDHREGAPVVTASSDHREGAPDPRCPGQTRALFKF